MLSDSAHSAKGRPIRAPRRSVAFSAKTRSDDGPEFVAEELRKWLAKLGTRTLYIEPESPGRTATVKEAQVVIEKWRVEYNTKRPHSGELQRKVAGRVLEWRDLLLTCTRGANPSSQPMAVIKTLSLLLD